MIVIGESYEIKIFSDLTLCLKLKEIQFDNFTLKHNDFELRLEEFDISVLIDYSKLFQIKQ